MLELLVTNGCSLTKGTELPSPAEEAWPAHVASVLDVPQVNLARGGASNRRIVRSTIMMIEAARRKYEVPAESVLSITVWSQLSRHEYYSIEGPDRQVGLLPIDENWHRLGPWRMKDRKKDSDNAAKAYYRHLWSEDGQMINFFLDWVLLDRYLKFHGYRTLYAFGFPLVDPIPEHAVSLMEMIDGDTVWGGLPPAPDMSFLEMPPRYARGPGGHPLQEGHLWFAEQLGNWMIPPLREAHQIPECMLDKPALSRDCP